MSKNLKDAIQNIMEENSTENIVIFTNHLKIDGRIHDFKSKCSDCHDCLIALQDVTICRLEDYCTCTHDDCECHDYMCFKYDWLNINISEIVTFSVVTIE